MARPVFHPIVIALLAICAFAPAHAATQGTVIIQSGPTDRGYQPAPTYQVIPAPAYQMTPAPTYQVIPAPPPPRYEAVPRARRHQAWEEGHWEWRGHRHHWVKGHWVEARRGHMYRQPQWVEHDGRWELRRGGWDRDGDGIANRHDRDRDGDGVPNRFDRQPDNPRRN